MKCRLSVGHEALKDTMWDLMLDAAGAIIVAVYGFTARNERCAGRPPLLLNWKNGPEKNRPKAKKRRLKRAKSLLWRKKIGARYDTGDQR